MDDIEVPKEVRPIMLEDAEETRLGDKRGAKKQYRYGNLHIREYDDKYTVHMDKVDPRKDPLGHLIHDAPEVLIGLGAAIGFGLKAYSLLNKRSNSIIYSSLASAISGYLGYRLSRHIKEK
ncbi:MAG: hypothetical protein D6752_06125 [Candidatus Nitrosothermus koennekii]|nr:MAG: hypothetical protein D6752_06125 [Candidatus Nitrosothermus koennekii]